MATITSLSFPSGYFPGSTGVVNGTGFGALQGASEIYYGLTASGDMATALIVSWSDTAITCTLDPDVPLAIGTEIFFSPYLVTADIGVRSDNVVVTANTALPTSLVQTTAVLSFNKQYPLPNSDANVLAASRGFIKDYTMGTYSVLFSDPESRDGYTEFLGVSVQDLCVLREPMLKAITTYGLYPDGDPPYGGGGG